MDRIEFKKKLWKWVMEIGNNIWEARKSGWFPYFLLIFLFTNITYGQTTEKSQKQQKVIEKRERSTPIISNTPSNTIRSPRVRAYRPFYYQPQQWGYTPYWNPNRNWDGRTYILTNDTSKTSPTPPLRISVGVLSEVTTQQPSVGPYLTIGQRTFVIIQYQWGGWNSFPYYDNIYPWEVEEWEDRFIKEEGERREFSIGVGTTIQRISPFIGVGFPNITTWDIYEDETFTLSSPQDLGYYAINQRVDRRVNLKLGLLYGWERVEGIIQLSSFGDGLRLGIGLGIKL